MDDSNAAMAIFASTAAFNGFLNDVKAEADDIYLIL
jgi:hypothetical protein